MPKQTSFSLLYKKLVDRHFTPDQQQLEEEMTRLLRQLASENCANKPNSMWKKQQTHDIIYRNEKKGTDQ